MSEVLEEIRKLQDDYVEAIEREDEGYERVFSQYIQVLEKFKAKIRKATMRDAKAIVAHCLFPEILRPVNGTS